MFGGTLALLNHSLQLDSRLLRHHLYRLLFVGIIYFCVMIATLMSMGMGAPGKWLFGSITYLNFTFITLAGISFFASAISEEKEQGTLGLLRMAGIGPASLLLGKSTSRLIVAGLLLSLQFPFTLLSITLGGVTALQVFAVFCGLLAYMALLANLALLCSVVAVDARRAAGLMVVLLVLFYSVPPIVHLVGSQLLRTVSTGAAATALQTVFDPRYEVSILNRLSLIMATGFGQSPFSFQVGSNFAGAAALFFISQWLLDRLTRYDSSAAATRRVLIRPRDRIRWAGTGRVWDRALMWKDFHFVTGGKLAMIVKFLLYGLLVGIIAYLVWALSGGWAWGIVGGWSTGVMAAVFVVESSVYASRFFNDELKQGTIPGLVMLPLTTWRIGLLKTLGCLLGIVPATLWLGVGCALLAPTLLFGTSDTTMYAMIVMSIANYSIMFLVFLHLTAYLSLVVKWGALPLALAILFFGFFGWSCIGGMFVLPIMMIAMAGTSEGNGILGALLMILPGLVVGAGLIAILQLLIAQRLRVVAGR